MEGPAPTSNTCSVFWKLWVSACGPPAWLTSTLPVAFWMGPTRMGRSTRMGLVSGHAQPGGSMGQGSKLRFQDQADWSQLSSITSMPRVTAAKPPSLSRNNGYKVLSTSWHRKRASYVIVLILKSCLAMQALRPTCCVALCKSLHFSKLGVQPIYNPSLLAGEAVILFPWQPICLSRDHLDHIILARCCPGNQVFVFCSEALHGGNSPHWGQGGGQAGGWKEAWPPRPSLPLLFLGPERSRPQSSGLWPVTFLEELFITSGFLIFLGASPGLLRLARWEPVPGAGLL